MEQERFPQPDEPVYDRPSFWLFRYSFEEMDRFTSLESSFIRLIWDAGRLFPQWIPEGLLRPRNLARSSRYQDGSNFFGLMLA